MTGLHRLADRLAIQDVLCRYARGIDRCDATVLKGVWWADAQVDYGSGPGNAHAWCDAVLAALRAMGRTQHFLGNMLIDVDGERAEAETYCRAYHDIAGDGGSQDVEVGGRYLDILERRDGEWRIVHRRYVLDWNRNLPSTLAWEGPMYGGLRRRGARSPDDPSDTGA